MQLYANVFGSSCIAIILLEIGEVVGWLDLSNVVVEDKGLRSLAGITSTRNSVLNGIAYRKTSKDIIVSGKYWKNVYRIEKDSKQMGLPGDWSSSYDYCSPPRESSGLL